MKMESNLQDGFQSSLEGNPEWNGTKESGPWPKWFQSSLEGNPEWNQIGARKALSAFFVSILTRGKPRVERVAGQTEVVLAR